MSNISCVKCDFTKRPLSPGEKNSVQLLLAKLDSKGQYNGKKKVINISGNIRITGKCDGYLFESECEKN